MTIKQLIAKLSKYDPKTQVLVEDSCTGRVGIPEFEKERNGPLLIRIN